MARMHASDARPIELVYSEREREREKAREEKFET